MSSNTRHLKLHYTVTTDLDLWWVPKLRKWLPGKQCRKLDVTYSSTRRFKTKKKAFKHAEAMGKGFIVTQYNPHCGWRRTGTWLTKQWDVL